MLALLLLAVLIPTLCVVWFMSQAVGNERFAVRQRLIDAYQSQLEPLRARLQAEWQDRLTVLAGDPAAATTPGASGAAREFERLVRTGHWDSAIVRDPSGIPLYPAPVDIAMPDVVPFAAEDELWAIARQLEADVGDYGAAAETYADIAGRAANPQTTARALQAQVRCLLILGDRAAARAILRERLLTEPYRDTTDEAGRSIAASAAFLLLELSDTAPADPARQRANSLLHEILTDYQRTVVPSAQRLFLMEQLRATSPSEPEFPTFAAERLAASYISARSPTAVKPGLARTALPGIWSAVPPQGGSIGLIEEQRIRSDAAGLLAAAGMPAGATVELRPIDRTQPSQALVVLPVGEPLAEWELAVTLTGRDPFSTAADRRIATHIWLGVLVILTTCLIAAAVARYMGRQVRLTRLKNDLIATVSHELKTPLASIRALVDTLLERDGSNPRQSREYLELIARENARLSRLIDNFLTFSRMERNRHAFELTPCPPDRIVEAACASVRERFETAGCRFFVEVAPGLPDVVIDADAMITVLLNLLDNACKYTGQDKCVSLRAYAAQDDVCFEVRDNGIGLSRRAMRRIFDRFYQVDQSLSRRAGGCGLGLSIVQFIVHAHGGAIDVQSQPGRGSTFTVKLPAVRAAAGEVTA